MKTTICIATHGDDAWRDLAYSHAYPSALDQGCEVLIEHDPDGHRHSVRNDLAERAMGEWLCFLDADDDLYPSYIAEMEYEMQFLDPVGRYLLTPAVAYSKPGQEKHDPQLLPTKGLEYGNCLILGTLIEREFFLELGGFRDWNARNGNQMDDWDLWLRALRAGAKIVQVPDAVYVARMHPSPSRDESREVKLHWQWEIGRAHFPKLYRHGWVNRVLAGEAPW